MSRDRYERKHRRSRPDRYDPEAKGLAILADALAETYRCNLCGVDHMVENGRVEHTVSDRPSSLSLPPAE